MTPPLPSTLQHAQWLDGDGPDNGAYQCSGNYDFSHLTPPYPALNASEVDEFCIGENAVQQMAHEWLFANGGMDGQACWSYVTDFPKPADAPAVCAQKLLAIDHRPTPNGTPTAFASDRCGGNGGYTDETAAQTIAAFLLARDKYWCECRQPAAAPLHTRPILTRRPALNCPPKRPPSLPPNTHTLLVARAVFGVNWEDSLNDTVAALMLTDYGAPLGNMSNSSEFVFSREYEHASVALDCATFTATFTPK